MNGTGTKPPGRVTVSAARRDELRRLAEQATPGPWYVVGPPWNNGEPWINAGTPDPHGGSPVCDLGFIATDGNANYQEDAAFIAACDPSTVAALLADLAAAEAVAARQREALEIAEREASVAHDAIWAPEVSGLGGSGFGVVHDSEREDSASSAIRRLHEAVRAVLAEGEAQAFRDLGKQRMAERAAREGEASE